MPCGMPPKSLHDEPDYAALAGHLRDHCHGKTAVYVMNGGNWGDSLIREGSEVFMRDHGIAYTAIRYRDIEKGRVKVADLKRKYGADVPLIYSGGADRDPRYGRLPLI